MAASQWPIFGKTLDHQHRFDGGPLATITVNPSTATVTLSGTQQFSATGVDANGSPLSITPTWTSTIGTISSSGLFTAGTTPGNGTVTATVDLVSGSAIVAVGLKWRYQTSGAVFSSPAIGSDGTIYVGSYDNYLYVINSDGTLRWRYQTGHYVWSSPAIGSDGTVYVGSRDNFLYAINSDGTLRWRYKTGDIVDSSPAVGSDDTIYVAEILI